MTLENCKELLEHYEKLARGEGIPEHHQDKPQVIARAKVSAEEMKARLRFRQWALDNPHVDKKNYVDSGEEKEKSKKSK